MLNDRIKLVVLTVVGLLAVCLTAASPFTPLATVLAIVGAVLAGISMAGLWQTVRAGRIAAEQMVDRLQHDVDGLNEQLQLARTQFGDMKLRLQLLQERRSSTESILNHIRDVVLVTDDRDRIVLANAAAQARFCFRFDPNVPVDAAPVIGDEGLLPLIQKSRTGRIAHIRHEITLARGGESATFEAVLSCSVDEAGRVSDCCGAARHYPRKRNRSNEK